MFPTKNHGKTDVDELNVDAKVAAEYDLDEFNPDSYEIDEIRVKLCDFSFSQIMTNSKKILGMMGTVPYSAPEVLEFDALTKATDMWYVSAFKQGFE
jgi:serine/threonine protein kinase